MAIERVVEIVAKTDEAVKEIKSLFNTMVDEQKKALNNQEDLNKEVSNISKSSKNAEKGINSIGKAFKGVGLAIKALGIGLLLEAFGILKDLFQQNQKVADFFSTTMETLSIVFNDFFTFIFDNAGGVIDFFKQIFENPLDSLKKFGELIKENLIERFNSALEVVGFLGDALKKLFEGDFKGALDSVKEAGLEFVDVLTGVDDAANKIADGVSNLVDKGAEYLTQTVKQAAANVQLKNTAELAAAQQARLVEIYDRQAEQLRQLRDDDTRTIADRIKSNEELALVLEKQEKAMLAAADAQVAAAQATLNTNNNIENQVALTDALANREGVLAQIEGFRSEQLINRNSLLREQIALETSISDAEKERRLAQLEFEENQEQNELNKLDRQRERLEEENLIIAEDLERKKELYAEGTQARVDAENDYLARKQEIDNALIENSRVTAEKQKELDKEVQDAKVNIASNTLGLIGEIAKEGSVLAKGVAVAQATISGIQGVQNAFTTAAASPITTVFPAYPAIQAGLAGAFSAVQIGKILSTDPSKGGGASSVRGSGGGGGQSAPSFNLVQGTGSNQIAETLGGQKEPLKAYVVTSDVSTGQSLDRNIVENASI